MLEHALTTVAALDPERLVVVVGHEGQRVGDAARRLRPEATIVEQNPQRGTGDAVRQALPALEAFDGDVLVLYADTPFVSVDTLRRLRATLHDGAALAVLGFEAEDGGAYGRLVLDDGGGLSRIVEAADAGPEERAIRLCNAGVMCFALGPARRWLAELRNDNAKGEFYLTDMVAAARADGARCAATFCPRDETLGVNSRAELAAAEAAFQARMRKAALEGGATLAAPDTIHFSFDTVLGGDVMIEPFVVFGRGVTIEDGAVVRAFSHLEGCILRTGASVGPFARIRPGSEIGVDARIGNFVEVKNAVLGPGAKANHLAYLGDATVGAGANIGAGAITCNYDGVSKHRTEIGAGAFVGSNASLVAPVNVGAGAYVASGSVVTRDVAPDALAISRPPQEARPGFAARFRRRAAKTPSHS